MESLTQYFQWGPDSMPRYMGFLTLLFGIATWLLVEGHSLKARKQAEIEKNQLNEAYQTIEKLQHEQDNQDFLRTTVPEGEFKLNVKEGAKQISFIFTNTHELNLQVMFSYDVYGSSLTPTNLSDPDHKGIRNGTHSIPIPMTGTPSSALLNDIKIQDYFFAGRKIELRFTIQNRADVALSKYGRITMSYDAKNKQVLFHENAD